MYIYVYVQHMYVYIQYIHIRVLSTYNEALYTAYKYSPCSPNLLNKAMLGSLLGSLL